jgi:thiamine pyrophosphate-dependent acetolactate synthase large subunit-like protein
MVSGKRPSRADYYRVLADRLPDGALVVTCLGNASYLWAAMHHTPENFYFEDAMGLALPLALGLAVAQPARRVIAVEGDGGLMMHMGALVTIGAVAPPNLTVLLIQNGVHAASGGQPLTQADLDLAALARAAGVERAENVATAEAFDAVLWAALASDGPHVLVLATEPDIEVVKPPIAFDPVLTKHRFMAGIGAPRYIPTLFGGGRLEPERPA